MDYIDKIIDECRASINKEDLLRLIPILKAKNQVSTVLEIGTWRGYSAELWFKIFSPQLLITVENDLDALSFVNERVKRGEFSNINPPIVQVVGDSTEKNTINEVKGVLGDRKVDFLFIDGNHMETAVQKDFYNYGSLVSEEGMILFHDTHLKTHPEVEVHNFWNYLRSDYSFVEIKSHDSTGMGLIFL